MRVLKTTFTLIISVVFLSAIGGYFYFKKQFTPLPVNITVKGECEQIPFQWHALGDNDYGAQLVPVKLAEDTNTYFLQLDIGSPYTMLYRKTLESINLKENLKAQLDSMNRLTTELKIDGLSISSSDFYVIDYGISKTITRINQPIIIGTLGTDIIEKRVMEIDFVKQEFSLLEQSKTTLSESFSFNNRRVFIPSIIKGKKSELMFDSGTSGYQLITNQSNWEKNKISNSEAKIETGNMWGRPLELITSAAQMNIEMGGQNIQLNELTYIKGVPFLHRLMMSTSGMDGMIGNKLFLDYKLTFDGANQLYKIEKSI